MKPLVAKNNVGMKGFYTFHKRTSEGDVPLLDGAVSDNLIVNAALDYFKSLVNSTLTPINAPVSSHINQYQLFRVFSVGTGSTEPTLNDTSLENTLATITENSNSVVNNTYSYDEVSDSFTYTSSKQIAFPLGSVVGNISEVGVFGNSGSTNAAAATTMFSRALIKDINGNPTTITLTNEDQLVVTYTLVMIVPRTVSFNFNYNGVDYNLEGKLSTNRTGIMGFSVLLACSFTGIDGVRSTDFSYPSPTSNGFVSGFTQLSGGTVSSTVPPLNPALVRKLRIRLPLASAVFTEGIKGLTTGTFNANQSYIWVFKFTPAFPKTANEILEIEFATDFVRL